MNRMFSVLALLFFIFIISVIYLANIGDKSLFFFKWVKALPFGDKLGHFCLFGLMALLLNLALKFKQIILWKRSIYLGSLIVVSFVVVEELSQFFIANRTMDGKDLIADFVGIYLFSKIGRVLFFRSKKSKI